MRKIFCIPAYSAILGISIGNGRGNSRGKVSSSTDRPEQSSAHFFEVNFSSVGPVSSEDLVCHHPLSVPSVMTKNEDFPQKLIKYLLLWGYGRLFQTKAHPFSAQTEVYARPTKKLNLKIFYGNFRKKNWLEELGQIESIFSRFWFGDFLSISQAKISKHFFGRVEIFAR